MTAPRSPDSKVFTRAQLLERFGRPRRERVVFTNGCFDLLHRGHLEYLCEARSLGDRLIVAVNDDESTRRLKGDGRPLLGQRDRALMLAGLECVDAVTIFAEDTPRELIAALLPDVLVKGGDYAAAQVVGRKEVEEGGGRLVLVPFREGYSTSAMLARMRGEQS